MSFGKAFSRMDAAIFKRGDDAIYNGKTLVKVFIDKDVERLNGSGEVLINKTELSVNKAEVEAVFKNDRFLIGVTTYTVKSIVSDDDSIVVVSVI